ncbi:chromosomal replication initiator protein DnaA [Clostridiaceae bacterium 68-1-5]|uniref:Chromosomal replication initiator protein DnaA n=1 Tax=Suipraeoptans intestinalis TaxID=2606628 RepID=A0A6N7USS8_9FIRM|nr:chromosomal replication initiator protein DnaA [Suipraeoptans intestinalis]MSR93918.1 chromosomal replication initiator protein DnaA [Suipraeoptans intestinalis]
MDVVAEKWEEIIEHLREEHELSSVSFKTWIKPLKIYKITNSTVYLLVNSAASVEYIERKYLLPLKVCIADIVNEEYDVVFLSEDDEQLDRFKDLSAESVSKKKGRSVAEMANLNPRYTFDTFVVGGNNTFAHAASLAVAESPGKVYNPLFIYGGVGLGKTHLMHSIANYILEQDPKKKVLYVTSETFTNELIEALKSGKQSNNKSSISNFRDKYRNNDVLLIDDIQFIIGKESTQEEFFHTFNHLYDSSKQIIISSDKPPKNIETLEERLRTRFACGIVADISAPNYETRMAILLKKIEVDHLGQYNIPNDVLDYIATNVKSNIRELEGSLNKLIALYKLNNHGNIDIMLAMEALKDIVLPKDKREVTPELILDVVSEHYNISVADLKSKKRNSQIAIPRQVAMYLMRTLTDAPLEGIGIILGGKDHTTVKYGVDKITSNIEEDEILSNTISIIKKKINPL